MEISQLSDFPILMEDVVELRTDGLKLLDPDRFRCEMIEYLIYAAVFSPLSEVREAARWVIWEGAHELGITSASIRDLYTARAKGEYKDLCIPAVNLRGLTYESARTMIRVLMSLNAGPFIFEITRNEIGYTFQRPAEYTASILAAAIKEGYSGPLFLQGDHFQIYPDKFNTDPNREIAELKALIAEAIDAGFYNIDIDVSRLVDLEKPSVTEQQLLNSSLTAELTAFLRRIEPEGVSISIGGEVGEIGEKNSTIEDLEVFLDAYNTSLQSIMPGATGLSKVSIQTGTVSGGIPLPDGGIAEVDIDFSVHEDLGRACREKYGLAGTVQQGASTLPDEAFYNFREKQCLEVHLSTGFYNLLIDHDKFPMRLRYRIYGWLKTKCIHERQMDQNLLQFIYLTRKKGFGPYKQETWKLPDESLFPIMVDLEKKCRLIFEQLGVPNTRDLLDKFISPKRVRRPIPLAFKSNLGMFSGSSELQ